MKKDLGLFPLTAEKSRQEGRLNYKSERDRAIGQGRKGNRYEVRSGGKALTGLGRAAPDEEGV